MLQLRLESDLHRWLVVLLACWSATVLILLFVMLRAFLARRDQQAGPRRALRQVMGWLAVPTLLAVLLLAALFIGSAHSA